MALCRPCSFRSIHAPALQETADHGILQPMSRSLLPEAVERYVTQEIARETDVQRRLRAETAGMPHGGMQIGADQGALLALLARLVGARRALEIGTFTGYSALAVAAALPDDGKLICCDVSEEWTSVAPPLLAGGRCRRRASSLRLAPATDDARGAARAGRRRNLRLRLHRRRQVELRCLLRGLPEAPPPRRR